MNVNGKRTAGRSAPALELKFQPEPNERLHSAFARKYRSQNLK
jgi:hypothetical protein